MPLLRDNKIQQPDSSKTLVEINAVKQLMPLLRENKIEQPDSNETSVEINTVN
jgi:hypothetical protein